MNKCRAAVAGDVSYFFAGGTGVASNINAIWGDGRNTVISPSVSFD